MKLYYAPASSYSQRVLIALYEKNSPFIPVQVDLFDPKERDRYLKINPFGKVPTLQIEDQYIHEACCIIEYLDQFQPEPKLIPSDRALEIRIIERTIDVYINNGREVLFADTQRPPAERGGKAVLKSKRLIETACRLLDQRLQSNCWLGGNTFSLADCTAAPTLTYLRWVYSYDDLPNLASYVQRLKARSSISKTFQEGRDQMQQLLSALQYPLEITW